MNKLDRRSFLKSSLLTTASLSLFPALGADTKAKRKAAAPVASHATGANTDVRFAVVGFGGRGKDHIAGLRAVDGTRMAALCDVDQAILGRELKKYSDLGEKITGYTDLRKLLENKRFKEATSHFANFIDAVRSRKCTDLHADILQGHLSSALCHTGNISYRLGKTHSPEEVGEAVKSNPDLAEALGRMEQHLAANNVDLKQTPATLGAALKMDPKTERFIDNAQADVLLTREYRRPFVVPAKV